MPGAKWRRIIHLCNAYGVTVECLNGYPGYGPGATEPWATVFNRFAVLSEEEIRLVEAK
jgi:hypothetical protein